MIFTDGETNLVDAIQEYEYFLWTLIPLFWISDDVFRMMSSQVLIHLKASSIQGKGGEKMKNI